MAIAGIANAVPQAAGLVDSGPAAMFGKGEAPAIEVPRDVSPKVFPATVVELNRLSIVDPRGSKVDW